LVTYHANLGKLLEAMHRFADADKCWLRILDLQDKLVKAFPQSVAYRRDFCGTLTELANRLVKNEKPAEARSYLEKAVSLALAAWKNNPQESANRGLLCQTELNLARVQVDLQDYVAAAKTVTTAREHGPTKPTLDHLFAEVLARCIPLVEKDKGLAEPKKKELVMEYGNQALALLRQAWREGFRDAAFLRTSGEFAAIRQREDFQALLREVEKGGKNTKKEGHSK
jgi:tetratricopeptide (TPR) repeat protein